MPAASSPPWTARRSPACSPQLAHRPPAVAPGPALPSGRADRGPAPGAGCCGCPQLPRFWGTGSPFPVPIPLLPLLQARSPRTHSLEGASKVTRGWGLAWTVATGLLCSSPPALCLLLPQGCGLPSPKLREGNWAGRQAGSRLGWGQPWWLQMPRTVRSSEAAKGRGCGSCGHALCSALGKGCYRGCRRHRDARCIPDP